MSIEELPGQVHLWKLGPWHWRCRSSHKSVYPNASCVDHMVRASHKADDLLAARCGSSDGAGYTGSSQEWLPSITDAAQSLGRRHQRTPTPTDSPRHRMARNETPWKVTLFAADSSNQYIPRPSITTTPTTEPTLEHKTQTTELHDRDKDVAADDDEKLRRRHDGSSSPK